MVDSNDKRELIINKRVINIGKLEFIVYDDNTYSNIKKIARLIDVLYSQASIKSSFIHELEEKLEKTKKRLKEYSLISDYKLIEDIIGYSKRILKMDCTTKVFLNKKNKKEV